MGGNKLNQRSLRWTKTNIYCSWTSDDPDLENNRHKRSTTDRTKRKFGIEYTCKESKMTQKKYFGEWMFSEVILIIIITNLIGKSIAHGLNVNQIYFRIKVYCNITMSGMYCLRLLLEQQSWITSTDFKSQAYHIYRPFTESLLSWCK